MKNIKIGNWLIDDDGIIWNGEYGNMEYRIPKNNILDNQDGSYEWLIFVANKTWVKREDIYALNSALIIAIDIFNLKIPGNISFKKTLEEQELILTEKHK